MQLTILMTRCNLGLYLILGNKILEVVWGTKYNRMQPCNIHSVNINEVTLRCQMLVTIILS